MRISILSILLCCCLISNATAQQCSIYIQMVPLGAEDCVLPQIVATGELLLPCAALAGFNQLEEGDFAYIDYIETGCLSYCQAGDEVDITCLSFPVGFVKEEAGEEIKVFPTVVRDWVYVEGEGIVQVEVYNEWGGRIKIIKEPDVSSIEVGSFVSGIYFIRIMTGKEIRVKKVFKL